MGKILIASAVFLIIALDFCCCKASALAERRSEEIGPPDE